MSATKPHINLLGHITPTELVDLMKARELSNGFANRFIIIWAEQPGLDAMPGFAAKGKGNHQQACSTQSASASSSAATWRDEIAFTLTPGQGTEIKLKMNKGEKASYSWTVRGGVVNFDTHGDALGRSVSDQKGRGGASDEGELIAAFTGNHGWFWRNRGNSYVTVVLKTGGSYRDIQRVQ